jgi:hypothetical protein
MERITFTRTPDGRIDLAPDKMKALMAACRAAKTGTLSYADPALIYAAGTELAARTRLRMSQSNMAFDEALLYEHRLEPGLLFCSQLQGTASLREAVAIVEDENDVAR